MRNLRKIDNDVSNDFDLQLFLTVRDILSNRQFDSYLPTYAQRKFYDICPDRLKEIKNQECQS
jgi:hypothetical protein